jgi:membrane protein
MKNNTHMPALLCPQDPDAWGGLKGRLLDAVRACYRLGIAFAAHQGPLHSAALTYKTILSLVPFLAIAFAVLTGLGVQNALEPLLLQVAGDSEETVARIISYVNNTNVKSLGAVGLLLLVLTVISLMGSIEKAFNVVWGVRESRPFRRRFSDYLSVVVVGPILLLAATSMNSSLQSQWLVKWLIEHTFLGDTILLLFRMVPYLFIWLAMTFTYIFIPNTRVHPGSAVLGGVLAGTAWQLAQWGYFNLQIGMANYNAIYGTLAALPVFLVWVYTGWLIVLFGLEAVYAHQHRAACGLQQGSAASSTSVREMLALAALLQVCRHFHAGTPPPATLQLADELGLPLCEMDELLEALQQLHLLARVSEDGIGWLPAHEPSTIMIDDVFTALRGRLPPKEEFAAACRPAVELFCREADSRRKTLHGLTLHDLVTDARHR